MMRLTFGEKQWMMMMWILLVILRAFSCATVNGWQGDPNSNGVLVAGDNCRTPTGEPGVCKRISICVPYVKKTIKYAALGRCSFIGNDEVTCCPQSSTLPSTTGGSVGTPTPITITRNENERPSQAACRRWKEYNPAALTFNILDGLPVGLGDYPHMGGLLFPVGGGPDTDVRCGASLIAEQYALTAAHCVNDPVALPTVVRFGVVVWNSIADGIVPVDVEVENITLHPEYRNSLKYNDIAIIKLRTNVDFTPFIRPACLYTDVTDIYSDTPLVVIGWGVTNIDTRERSEVLLMTNLTTVPLTECNATHIKQGVQRSYKNGLSEGQYCAYDPELQKSACQADSGGPLQLVQNRESTIVGIVSFGLSCASIVPAVYTRVAFYLPWIESIVWPS